MVRPNHLEAAVKILEFVSEEGEDEVRMAAIFAAEQLRIVSKPPGATKYFSLLMGNTVIREKTSPKVYELLYDSAMFRLHNR